MKASRVDISSLCLPNACSSVLDARLLEITQLSLNPPRAPTPTQESAPEVADETVETPIAEGDLDMSASNQPLGVSAAGSFDFMQASELETPFEDNAEWVERSDAVGHQEEQVVEPINGHIPADEPIAPITPTGETVSLIFPRSFLFIDPQLISSSRAMRLSIGQRTMRKVDCRL